ncbi:MAG: phage integrase SAM-like domain-containing protein [Bacteroidaceae bacterium]|nr:phage integrase SAM-like domain-containing protein [Bacteroidaceae bacterium]
MATSFVLELNNRPNKSGKWAILLRITQDRKLRRIKTPIELKSEKDWNKEKKCIRSSEPNYRVWNDSLEKFVESAKSDYRKLRDEGKATVGNIIFAIEQKETSSSFLVYAKKRTQEIFDDGGVRNWRKYYGFCVKLEKFMNGKDLTFKEITPAFVDKFYHFLCNLNNSRITDPSKKAKLSPNTIEVQFNIFKRLVNHAIDLQLMPSDAYPFNSLQIKTKPTEKAKLSEAEIQRIAELEVPEDSLVWHCRNYFMFSYYCAGIRVGDFLQLRWSNVFDNNQRLTYQMDKNGKIRDMILVEPAQKILKLYEWTAENRSNYIFPLLDNNAEYALAADRWTMPAEIKKKLMEAIGSKTASINKQLKKLAELADIPKENLSFHISRHTFAHMAKIKGIDNLMVQEMLAHSNLKTTERYMGNFDHATTDAALQSVFEKPVVEEPKVQNLSTKWNYCPSCGTKLDGNFKFCPGCGKKLE